MTPLQTHSWSLSTSEAKQLQHELVGQLIFEDVALSSIQYVAGADVAFHKDEAFACVVLFSFPELELVDQHFARRAVRFPYVPGFLSFREGEVLLDAFALLKTDPDVLLFDGQGIAHQRHLGLAAHMGLLFDKPSVGCAKSRLVGHFEEPDSEKGSRSSLIYQNEEIGSVVRTRTNVRPMFISPGHRMTIDSAVELALACTTRYRLPEPTRAADKHVGEYKRKSISSAS